MAEYSGIDYDPSTYWTAPARNFRSSARLHLQHHLVQKTLGYLLESHVQAFVTSSQGHSDSPLRVADLGCGNGAWLLDLHDEFSQAGVSARLDGYDINAVNFPAPAFLPPTVRLKPLDVFQPLPAELAGVYDVVHVRAFVSILADTGPAPLLAAALALLKPGGYLQWEDSKGDHFLVEAPSADTPRAACDALVHMARAASQARGSDFSFIDELDQKVKDSGFEDVHMVPFAKRRRDYKAWTDDYLMVFEELFVHFPPRAEAPTAAMTREGYLDLFRRVVAETEQGVVIHQGRIMTVVGRKPM